MLVGRFERPRSGPSLAAGMEWNGEPLSTKHAWQSQGGRGPVHAAKQLPNELMIEIPVSTGIVNRIHFVGIFGLYATTEDEAPGTVGASLIIQGENSAQSLPLVCGTHYLDAHTVGHVHLSSGDGIVLQTIGSCKVEGKAARVDVLSIDLPEPTENPQLRFVDCGTDTSFCIFDVFVEAVPAPGCPFHAASRGVTLDELAAVVRVGDRVRFGMALQQAVRGIEAMSELEEAKGLALTFLSVICAAMLEVHAERQMHRFVLRAARELDALTTPRQICEAMSSMAEELTNDLMKVPDAPTDAAIARALAIIDRNFGKDLSDETIARSLGLSTSHFRFLFKKYTGKPFQRYLMSVRLEKSKKLLVDLDLSVTEVARMVGFSSPAHFSRAFAERFSAAPSLVRATARTKP